MNANMNPFMNVDMSKFMSDFDPSKFAESFTKMTAGYNVPQVNFDAIIDAQRKNMEVLTAVNKAAVESVQALAQRQNEIAQELAKEATDALADLSKLEGPEDAAAKQAELIKSAFEKAVSNSTELAEMMTASNNEATKVINARITESLDEIRKQAVTLKKKK
jgi:phasin family protein